MSAGALRKGSRAAFCALLGFVFATAPAAAQNPAAPPGLDPGGPAIALISTGVDYTDPEIAPRLARDGEGEPIAWDFAENDLRPFASPDVDNGTKLAKLILSVYGKARLINVRISQQEPDQLAKAVMFVARTPALIAVVGATPNEAAGWERFGEAVKGAGGNVLFLVPGEAPSETPNGTAYPVQLNLDNVMTAAPLPAKHGDQTTPLSGAVDAWIKPRAQGVPGGISGGGEAGSDVAPTMVPANGLEAAAMLGGFAACVLDGRDVTQFAVIKSILQENAVPAEEGVPRTIYDPVCADGK